jgi:peptidoglycan/LPS O-acetylase OafA/YrhL
MASHWPFANRAQRWIEVLYLATFRPVFGIAVAVLMLLSLSNHPIGRVLGRFLSLRIFYPISQLAYSAYLLNPMVTTCVDRSIFPWVALHPVRPLLVYVPLDVIGTFAAAAVLHLAVERPILRLRPRPAVSRSS